MVFRKWSREQSVYLPVIREAIRVREIDASDQA